MYAFAGKPRWIVGHVLVIVLVVVFVMAGLWQWSRHQWRSDMNDAIEARAEMPVLDVAALTTEDPDDLEFRLATVAGAFTEQSVLIRSQSLDGQPGCHVVQPFVHDDQRAVIVNRGWIPLEVCESASPLDDGLQHDAITGRVQLTETRGRFGVRDPAEGVLEIMARVDIERLQQQSDVELAPVYLEQVAPSNEGLPRLVPPPATDAGPHLGYTFQWFSFAAVAIIGYPLVLRRQARTADNEDV